MSESIKKDSADIFQLKITLLDTKPQIWRRILVKANATLADLHKIIQVAMGWDNYHMHQYKIGQDYYGVPHEDFDYEVKNERKFRLSDLYEAKRRKFVYEYDFGDSWYHEIKIEKSLAHEKGVKYPTCIEGENAAPPEDCGGIPGFYQLLHTLKNPKNPEYRQMKEWAGDYNPDRFDTTATNRRLHRA